jgi:hypothetical protein
MVGFWLIQEVKSPLDYTPITNTQIPVDKSGLSVSILSMDMFMTQFVRRFSRRSQAIGLDLRLA